MGILSIGLILLSAVLHAIRDFYVKKALDTEVFIWWYQVAALVLYLPFFLYFWSIEGALHPTGIFWALISGGAVFFYLFAMGKAYGSGDLSHVYPIIRSKPALVLIFAVLFLHEQVSFVGILGIFTVTLGIYMINLKRLHLQDFLAPLQGLLTEPATKFAFLGMLAGVAYSLADKIGIAYIHPLLFVYLINIFGTGLFTPYILSQKSKHALLTEWNQNKQYIVFDGIILLGGYILVLIALMMENVSYVVAFRQISIVFAVLLGGHLLKEKHFSIRLLASIIIFSGCVLIALAE